MEKTVVIDGCEVRLKSTAAFLLRYKAQFGRDVLKDMARLHNAVNKQTGELEDADAFDLELCYNMAWVLAKTADPSIPEPERWLDQFGEFPIEEVMKGVIELVAASLTGTKKK